MRVGHLVFKEILQRHNWLFTPECFRWNFGCSMPQGWCEGPYWRAGREKPSASLSLYIIIKTNSARCLTAASWKGSVAARSLVKVAVWETNPTCCTHDSPLSEGDLNQLNVLLTVGETPGVHPPLFESMFSDERHSLLCVYFGALRLCSSTMTVFSDPTALRPWFDSAFHTSVVQDWFTSSVNVTLLCDSVILTPQNSFVRGAHWKRGVWTKKTTKNSTIVSF